MVLLGADVLCLCEVGEAIIGLNQRAKGELLTFIRRGFTSAGRETALGHSFMGHHLIVWDSKVVKCVNFQDIQKLHPSQDWRHAQYCKVVGAAEPDNSEGIHVVNTHQPSSGKRLLLSCLLNTL